MKEQKSYYAKPEDITRKWYIVDATDQVLGRLASEVAKILRGKNKPQFTPSVDMGDFVIVLNALKVKVTGNKEKEKKYYNHSGYPGGLKEKTLEFLRKKNPEEILMRAIKGMLPHNKIGKQMLKKVKIYKGAEHSHEAQNPEKISVVKEKG